MTFEVAALAIMPSRFCKVKVASSQQLAQFVATCLNEVLHCSAIKWAEVMSEHRKPRIPALLQKFLVAETLHEQCRSPLVGFSGDKVEQMCLGS
jgi:hypothetical protein